MTTVKSERARYNAFDDYDEQLRERRWLVPGLLTEGLRSHLRGGETVLDVGCGTGIVGAALRKARWRGTLVGVDIAEKRLREAFRKPGYSFLAQMNAYRLGFSDRSFDAVVSSGMVGITGPRSVWEMRRVLKPAGYLACVVGETKDLDWCRERFKGLCQRLDGLSGMRRLLRKDLGTGYATDYEDEHYRLYIFQRL